MPALQSYGGAPPSLSSDMSLSTSSHSLSPLLLQDPTLEFLRKFAIGLLSGTISSCVNIPFDVAKSRIQGPQPEPGVVKYRTCFQTMALVSREEGYEPDPVWLAADARLSARLKFKDEF